MYFSESLSTQEQQVACEQGVACEKTGALCHCNLQAALQACSKQAGDRSDSCCVVASGEVLRAGLFYLIRFSIH